MEVRFLPPEPRRSALPNGLRSSHGTGHLASRRRAPVQRVSAHREEPVSETASLVAVVLAAGKGKRLKSTAPKVLHPICGRPALWWVLQDVR